MATSPDELIFDPMAGSGTAAAVCLKNKRRAIICDASPEYIALIEKRINIKCIDIKL
jgi:DNA modification methylase